MLFSFYCIDRSDVPGLRLQIRPVHLDHLNGLGATLKLAGPLLDEDGQTPIGSLVIVEAEDLAQAETIAAADPYAKAGLFASVMVQPFRLVFEQF